MVLLNRCHQPGTSCTHLVDSHTRYQIRLSDRRSSVLARRAWKGTLKEPDDKVPYFGGKLDRGVLVNGCEF